MPKRKLRNLKLRAIAAVDNPCQEHALAVTIKRYEDPDRAETADFLAKYVCENDGAHTFAEVLRVNMFSEKIWPCVDAFSQSIRSIVGDTSLTGAARAEKIGESTGQFLAAVRAISPDVSKRLEPLVRKEGSMAKTVEELQAEVEKLTGQLTSANALVASEKARADKAEADLKAEKAAHDVTKADLVKATDEEIVVGGETVKLSEVGKAQFSVVKALRDERDMAQLEKRAETEFGHVVGTAKDKALILKSIDALPDENETKKATLAVLTAAEKMAKQGFENLGRRDGELTETGKAAVKKFEDKVAEVVAAEKCSEREAMRKVRQSEPELYREYQDAQG